MKAAFVAGGGIRLDYAPLGCAIHHRKGGGQELLGGFGVFGFDDFADCANLVAEAGAALTIDRRAAIGFAGVFDCREMISHLGRDFLT